MQYIIFAKKWVKAIPLDSVKNFAHSPLLQLTSHLPLISTIRREKMIFFLQSMRSFKS